MQDNSSRHSPATQAAHRDVYVGSVGSVGSVGICKYGKPTGLATLVFTNTIYRYDRPCK